MAQLIDMDGVVDQELQYWKTSGPIVGVVKDFHATSMHRAINPLIIVHEAQPRTTIDQLYVRVAEGQMDSGLLAIRTVFKEFIPSNPFEYHVVDDEFGQMYRAEMVLVKLAASFAVLAGLISCLGLFGLASFSAAQRTKEIGIRKTLGATVPNLIVLLSLDFLKLVAIAFVLAAPIAYYVLNGWLTSFAYRTNLGWGVFALSGTAAFLIAWLTIGAKAFQSARANPVDALRCE